MAPTYRYDHMHLRSRDVKKTAESKNEETIIQVWGMGPATSTPAEKR